MPVIERRHDQSLLLSLPTQPGCCPDRFGWNLQEDRVDIQAALVSGQLQRQLPARSIRPCLNSKLHIQVLTRNQALGIGEGLCLQAQSDISINQLRACTLQAGSDSNVAVTLQHRKTTAGCSQCFCDPVQRQSCALYFYSPVRSRGMITEGNTYILPAIFTGEQAETGIRAMQVVGLQHGPLA